jgi:hypothetical protein
MKARARGDRPQGEVGAQGPYPLPSSIKTILDVTSPKLDDEPSHTDASPALGGR